MNKVQNSKSNKSFFKEHKQSIIRWCALGLVIIMVSSTVVGAILMVA